MWVYTLRDEIHQGTECTGMDRKHAVHCVACTDPGGRHLAKYRVYWHRKINIQQSIEWSGTYKRHLANYGVSQMENIKKVQNVVVEM